MNNQTFMSATQLLQESWKIYCRRIKTLSGIIALPVVVSLIFNLSVEKAPLEFFSLVIIISFAITLCLWLLATPALIYSIKNNSGIKESYLLGFKMLIPYVWISCLVGLITFGGFMLLIIPGIIFSIWFCLSSYILIFENKRGMKALSRSKHMVSSNFWKVLWRLFVLTGAIFVVIIPFGFLMLFLGGEELKNIVSPILSLFTAPFSAIYGILIYKNLLKITAETPEAVKTPETPETPETSETPEIPQI